VNALLARVRPPRSVDLSRYTWFFAAFAYVFVMSVASTRLSWNIWAGIAFAPILFAITIPLLKRGLRNDPDPRIGQLVIIAFVAKMLGAAARYAVTYGLYDRADASEYHNSGARLAEAFWAGDWARVSLIEVPELTGTPFIRLVTGLVYIVTKPTIFGGFVVFSWLSFLGLFFFYKAIVIGFPEANHRRYAYLIFFLPSMLYWPSSIGKEAWISFGLGLASYGIALILRHQPLGYPVAGLGLLATAGPRPHITVLCTVALGIAYVLRRRSWSDSTLGPVSKVVGIVVMLAVGVVVVSKAAAYFDVDQVSSESVTSVLDYADKQSGQGGSEYEAVRVKSPAEFPNAFLAVLFRPWPWEASSAQALIASAEGTMLLVLGVAALPRLIRLPRYIFQVPYVAYALAYTIMFVIAFSSIANFGILTRQRTQVLPLLLVLLVLPAERQRLDDYTPTVEERARTLIRSPARPSPLS
jgi:hypothetical protein